MSSNQFTGLFHMKEKRIINFPSIAHFAGFRNIPTLVVTDKATYHIVQDQSDVGIYCSEYQEPADITIMTNRSYNSVTSVFPAQYNEVFKSLFIPRYSKAVQSCLLKDYFNRLLPGKVSLYHHLDTFSDNFVGKLPRFVPEGKYIVKPTLGARSMGIIEVDTAKIHIHEFYTLLDLHLKAYGVIQPGDKLQINEPGFEPTPPLKLTDYLKEFLEKHDFPYNFGLEYKPDEAAEVIRKMELIVQEKNPFDSVIELRALRCLDVEPVIYERQDLDTSFNGYSEPYVYNRNNETVNEILAVLKDPNFPGFMGSVDLWISEETGNWGIYEFQPEYSSVNIRVVDHQRFLIDSLDAIWEACKGEN